MVVRVLLPYRGDGGWLPDLLILDCLFFHATLGKEAAAGWADKVQEWRPGEQERDDGDGNDEGNDFVRHVTSPGPLARGGLGNKKAWLLAYEESLQSITIDSDRCCSLETIRSENKARSCVERRAL